MAAPPAPQEPIVIDFRLTVQKLSGEVHPSFEADAIVIALKRWVGPTLWVGPTKYGVLLEASGKAIDEDSADAPKAPR